MSEPPSSYQRETFPLRSGRPPVVLHATGFRHPGGFFSAREHFTPYANVTQVLVTLRGLRLATRSGVFQLRRDAFESADAPEVLTRALYARIMAQPGGTLQLQQMQRLQRWMLGANPRWLSYGVSLACVLVFALQEVYFPWVELAGVFSAELVGLGEWWRLVTANFLHAFLLHLVLNALCLLGLGLLLERSLGSARAALVMAVSGIGAMGGSYLAGYQWAVGASGIVAGLVGGLIWLEFRRPEQLPVAWRIPRPLFVGALVGEAVLLMFVPGVAHAAHLGGIVSGTLATALLAPPELGPQKTPRWMVPTCGVVAVGLVAATLAAAWPVLAPGSAVVERRAANLLSVEGVPLHLNNVAWVIVTGPTPEPGLLDVALQLAERAVAETGREDPNILDTLAEAYFVAGQQEEAIATIDEAIYLAPGVAYFREQRRRFTGERDPDDRPDPPSEPWMPRMEPLPPPPEEDLGIRV